MNELEFQEEWLSAYLDDELTDEQRQVVEQRLAIDPTAQATLEDLQRVRTLVAKLPSWSGPDLKFAIPADLPSSFDEADHFDEEGYENVDDSDGELEDFEEVPRLIAGAEEPRVSAAANANWTFNSRSTSSILGWIATAASVLLVAGMGYLFWPTAGPQVANLELKQAPPVATSAAPRTFELEQASGLEREELSTNGDDALGRAMKLGLQVGGEDQGETRLVERTDPAPLAMKSESIVSESSRLSDSIGLSTEDALASDKKESKMKAESYSNPANPQQTPSAGLAGGFGGRATMALGLDRNLPADAPVADLPPPPAIAPRSLATPSEISNGASADDYIRDNKTNWESNSALAPGTYFARSQSWMDEETQASLSNGAYQYRADQLAFGNNSLQRGAEQKNGDIATESVIMAGIKPEVANSPEFFQDIVTSNKLIAVEQQPAPIPLYGADQLQTANSASARNRDAGTAVPLIESANTPAANLFSTQRFQMGMPNSPQGNSFVLFLNRDEANHILNQLQERGQVSSQVWRVIRQPDTQTAIGKNLNVPAPAEPQVPSAPAAAPSTSGTDPVILLLNGPPQ